MKVLILEDDYLRHKVFKENLIGHVYTICTTTKSLIQNLETDIWDYLFLDHDLNGQVYVPSGKDTGYEVAEWIVDHPERRPKRIIIHSFNEEGVENMSKLLQTAVVFPGAWKYVTQILGS